MKVKDEYNIELQAPETMKLFGSTKKSINKTKNGKKVPSPEVVKVVLVQCNLEITYQEKFEVLYTFRLNKSYAHLLNFESCSLVFWKLITQSLMKLS